MELQQQRTAVYKHYCNDDLMYVGISNRPAHRTRQHMRDKDWMPDTTRIDLEWYENRKEAENREKYLIRKHRPPKNIQHNVGQNGFNSKKAVVVLESVLLDLATLESPDMLHTDIEKAAKDARVPKAIFDDISFIDDYDGRLKAKAAEFCEILEAEIKRNGFGGEIQKPHKICDAKWYLGVLTSGCDDKHCEHFIWE